MFLLDTPGVMMPNITSHEVALKLAIAGETLQIIFKNIFVMEYLM